MTSSSTLCSQFEFSSFIPVQYINLIDIDKKLIQYFFGREKDRIILEEDTAFSWWPKITYTWQKNRRKESVLQEAVHTLVTFCLTRLCRQPDSGWTRHCAAQSWSSLKFCPLKRKELPKGIRGVSQVLGPQMCFWSVQGHGPIAGATSFITKQHVSLGLCEILNANGEIRGW